MASIASRPAIVYLANRRALGADIPENGIDDACRAVDVARSDFDATVAALKNDSPKSPPQKAASSAPPRKTKGHNAMFNQQKRQGPQSAHFWDLVESKVERGMTRERAIESTVADQPELHQAILSESNQHNHR